MKVVLNPKIRTTERTHQNHISTQNELMIDNNVDSLCQPNHWSTRNKGIEQACYPVMQDHSEQYCAWTMNPNSVQSIIYRS